MTTPQAHAHHYVPRWYQKRFLKAGQNEYHYLDLRPETIVCNGKKYTMRALRWCGPARSFCEEHLYTVRLGNWSTDNIERKFFGAIDSAGRNGVEIFSEYHDICEGLGDAYQSLVDYMDAQRVRTPRGLDLLKKSVDISDQSQTLLAMRKLYRWHTTMWMEGVWEIARARQSQTKFIVCDEPVTFFNRRGFPSEFPYPTDIGLEQTGTRTLFPLGLDSCLIITHLQLVRDPWADPLIPRVNARSYQFTMKHLGDIQFGRELEEDEVLRINYILKRRATRYIAAAEESWLYPEERLSSASWSKLDHDWFLLPNLYKVPFTTGMLIGKRNGPAWAMDEYGRNPGNPKYEDKALREKERITTERGKREWARVRAGKSVAHVGRFEHDEVYDKIMLEDQAGQSREGGAR